MFASRSQIVEYLNGKDAIINLDDLMIKFGSYINTRYPEFKCN